MESTNPICHWAEHRVVGEEGRVVVREVPAAKVPKCHESTVEAHALGDSCQEKLRALVKRLCVTPRRRGRRRQRWARIDCWYLANHRAESASDQADLCLGHVPLGGHGR